MRVFVSFNNTNSVLQSTVVMVARTFGAEVVSEIVNKELVEADIAIANSVPTALRMIKETETTTVVIAHFTKEERASAEAFVERFPTRVLTTPFVGFKEGDVEFVPFILNLFGEKNRAKEVVSANPTA